MIKDIVVNLSVGERGSSAGDYAVSVAAAFDAHLTGIAFVYDPIVPVSRRGLHPRRSDRGAAARQRRRGQGRHRPLHRGEHARRRHAPSRSRSAPASPASASSSAASRGASISPSSARPSRRPARRRRDDRREPLCSNPAGRSSSCPTSRKRRSSSTGSWCAGTAAGAATRAIADAMPLLERAGQRRGGDRRQRSAASRTRSRAPTWAQHLARHGLNVEVKRISRRRHRRRRRAALARRRCRHRFHRHGRLRPFAPARIRARRRDPHHSALDDRPGADVALSDAGPDS